MHTIATICEFNPFHTGHAYLLTRMRETVGEDGCVICLMSGRTVQRGTLAVADPYLRAHMALAGGADLVLELPFPWSSGSAAYFAGAGVYVLSRLGVERLAFGSECGDTTLLMSAANAVCAPAFGETYASLCTDGMGSTAAYLSAMRTMINGGDLNLPNGFPQANDLLGINYLAAVRTQNSVMTPYIVRREGHSYHDIELHPGEYPSATALRLLIREAACDPDCLAAILEGTIPEASLPPLLDAIRTGDVPVDSDRLLPFFHAFYRLTSPETLTNMAELSGGLAAYICKTARETATSEAFSAAMKTKRYTDARIRRGMLFGVTGVTEEDMRSMPTYTLLLGATQRGCEFLSIWKKNHGNNDLKIVTKPADAPDGKQKAFTAHADALFTLCTPVPREAGAMMKKTPPIEYFLKNKL